jgi:FkbM family methyltransferase
MAGLLTRVRSKLHAAAAARDLATHWEAKYAGLREQVRERRRRDRQEHATLKSQSARRARRLPSVETLQHMLRARTARAQARAACLRPVVPEGGTSVEMDGRACRSSIDGLTWWVPALPSQSVASVERMLAKQRFPYLTIAQTRDVSIGGIMLDIGANVGRMAIPRVILGDVTRAYCIEPDELNYQCLVANVRDNGLAGLVVSDNVAISDRIGRLPLHRGKMSGAHRLVHTGGVSDRARDVPCTTLDAWVADRAIDLADVTFVKVDTQGSELHVLAGASRVLAASHIAWQIEIAPSHLRLAGSDPQALYSMLTDRFSHFVDLNPDADGPRLRSTAEIGSALAYLERVDDGQTDVVVYRAAAESLNDRTTTWRCMTE